MAPLIAIVTTHTTRHLRRCLLGVAAQSRRADRVLVTCDGDGMDLCDEAAAAATEFALPLTLIRRAHAGVARSGQVRNNAVRAIAADAAPAEALLVFLDGDICPAPGCFAAHEHLSRAADLVLAYRIDLTEQQTADFDESALRAGRDPAQISADQDRDLTQRQQRYRRALLLRRIGLGKPHKPKLLSANFSVRLRMFMRVNGFDELYEHYGQEDDDLGRRLHAAGARTALGLVAARAYHLWHPTTGRCHPQRTPLKTRRAAAQTPRHTRTVHGARGADVGASEAESTIPGISPSRCAYESAGRAYRS
jgi:hypothetical protein